eukprot:jgi/Tetstr1/445798/TSEL_033444.t1
MIKFMPSKEPIVFAATDRPSCGGPRFLKSVLARAAGTGPAASASPHGSERAWRAVRANAAAVAATHAKGDESARAPVFRTLDEFQRAADPDLAPYEAVAALWLSDGAPAAELPSAANCHDGQTKLALAMLDFLIRRSSARGDHLVYVGASSVAAEAARLAFPAVHQRVFDPAPDLLSLMPRGYRAAATVVNRLGEEGPSPEYLAVNGAFTDATPAALLAGRLAGAARVLFVSDIRVNNDECNILAGHAGAAGMGSRAARRLLHGQVSRAAYEPPMSAELRLVRAAGANGRLYTAAVDVSRVEQLMMAFNMLWRTHALYKGGAASYDVAAERSILAALPSGTAARALALIDEHRARVGKGDVSTWLLVYVCSMESMCVFAPLADDIDWARIGSGADLEPYEPGPQAFARWVAPAPCTGVTETRMEFESFVGRRVTGSRVTRADELRELLAALPHVPETTTTVDVVGITQVDAERDMVRRSTPSHVRTVTFRADHRSAPQLRSSAAAQRAVQIQQAASAEQMSQMVAHDAATTATRAVMQELSQPLLSPKSDLGDTAHHAATSAPAPALVHAPMPPPLSPGSLGDNLGALPDAPSRQLGAHDLGRSLKTALSQFSTTDSWPIYRDDFLAHLTTVNPVLVAVLLGARPPAHGLTAESFSLLQQQLSATLTVVMKSHPTAATRLRNLRRSHAFAAADNPGTLAWDQLCTHLDRRGVARTVRHLLALQHPQSPSEDQGAFTQRMLNAYHELNDSHVSLHSNVLHENRFPMNSPTYMRAFLGNPDNTGPNAMMADAGLSRSPIPSTHDDDSLSPPTWAFPAAAGFLSVFCGKATAPLPVATSGMFLVDGGANICLAPDISRFRAYSPLTTPVPCFGLGVDILGFGSIDISVVYTDGVSRPLTVRPAHAPGMTARGAPTILSQEYLRREHGVSFSYPARGAPSAADSYGSLVLTMINHLPFLTGGHAVSHGTAPPSACLACKGPPESPPDAHRLQLRLGHPGRDGMKALLRSESIVGVPATADAAMPDCEPCIMGKLRHASVSRAPASAVQPFSAFSSDVFGPVDVPGSGRVIRFVHVAFLEGIPAHAPPPSTPADVPPCAHLADPSQDTARFASPFAAAAATATPVLSRHAKRPAPPASPTSDWQELDASPVPPAIAPGQYPPASRIPVPDTIKQALAGKYHKEWRAFIVSEFRSLRARNTFAYALLPVGRHAIGNKRVFKVKANSDGSVNRFKARLVAQGFSQQAGVDYHATFSPVVKLSTLRTCLTVAAARGMHIHHIDIETAFLNASLKEEIYMRQPKGAEDGTDNVLPLLKSIYGLKQASREWYELIHKTLTGLGLARSNSDTSMYNMNHPRYGICIVLVYVDDILVVSDSVEWIRSAKSAIGDEFNMTDFGEAAFVMGMDLTRCWASGTIRLSQEQYTLELLEKHGMQDCSPAKTPMGSGHYKDLASASDADKAPLSREDHETCRAILGSVNFLTMCTRPDLAFAISVLSRFQSAPQKVHLMQLKRVLRYLKGTPCMGITYGATEPGGGLAS